MELGICKLCLKQRPLCKSHLIPKGVYALCRARTSKNPNPLLITHKLSMQTSRQLKTPLLCFDCEQLLRAKGEDWVIPQLAHIGGPFPLGDTLAASAPLFAERDVIAYLLQTIPNVRLNELVHFAMAIFWKASVHSWVEKPGKPWLLLGPHGEDLRKFILGKAVFPAEMALSLTVLPNPVALISFHYPYKTIGPDPTCHLYVSGLNFILWMGPNIPAVTAQGSLHRPPHLALVVDIRDAIIKKFRDARQSAMKSTRRAPESPSKSLRACDR
jgi:hypothetical protein